MPPASAKRAGGMPKASRDRSLGTFGKNMNRSYIIGLSISVLTAITTLVVRDIISQYPSIGDVLIFYWFGKILPLHIDIDGRVIIYTGKTIIAALSFTTLFQVFRKNKRFRFFIALIPTIIGLIVLSLGDKVVI